jgi:hypothetical protein
MAKKQTRRSISVSGPLYDRFRAYCHTNDVSMSSVVTKLVTDHLDQEESDAAPDVPPEPVVTKAPPKETAETIFTF